MIRHLRKYIAGALQFYKLKKDITPAIFSMILFTGLIGIILPQEVYDSVVFNFVYNIFYITVVTLSSAVYLYANIKDLKNEGYEIENIRELIRKNGIKIILARLLVLSVTIFFGMFLIIPGIVLYHMFIFVVSYIADKELSVRDAFNASSSSTRGRKVEIFVINLIFSLILMIPFSAAYFLSQFLSPNPLVPSFILSFASAVISLMHQRLVAFMYVDIVYDRIYEDI